MPIDDSVYRLLDSRFHTFMNRSNVVPMVTRFEKSATVATEQNQLQWDYVVPLTAASFPPGRWRVRIFFSHVQKNRQMIIYEHILHTAK